VADTAGQVREALRDRYLLERELGQGGMATVYLAHDLKHDRDVALKVLRPELAAVLGRERFLAEIRLTAKLDHPHILTLIDSGESDGLLWYVVPFIRGESLRQKLQREKQLGVEEALAITKQVAGALEYAHQHGVIHRDLKPENVLLHEGEAMLADFGIALAVKEAGGNRLTETGLSLGTPQYMSPEQATGDRQLDARSDVYSLGAVLYEMLAGEPPHTGATVQAVIAKLMTERPTRLKTVRDTVPEGVDAAVARALAKVPADRFSSTADLVKALSRPELTSHLGRTNNKGARGRRRSAAGALVLLSLLGIAYLGRPHSRHPAADYRRIQLTTSGEAHTPVLSPDGSQVAYAARECPDDKGCVWSIVVRETATGVERPIIGDLSEASIRRWSPNGLWLLYETVSPGGTYTVPRIGGSATRLGLGPADFLPSGDMVLVAAGWRADKTMWLRRFALPSSQPSDSIAIEVPRRALGLNSLSVAPNGRWFALAWGDFAGAGMISVHDPSGKLVDSIPMNWPHSLRWVGSSSSGLLLPMIPRTGPPANGALLKIAVDPATGRLGAVDTLIIAPISGSWPQYDLSADGRSLVYALAREGESVLWTLERIRRTAPPRPLRRVTTSSRRLDAYVTRDGKSVLYSTVTQAESQEGLRWYVAPFEGGVPRAVTPGITDAIFPSASDDRRLFIATRSPAGRARITAFDLVTGRATPFAEQPSDRFTIWSGVRGGIAVLSATGDSLRLLDSLGREFLRTGFDAEVGRMGLVASSPDGKELALFPIAPPEPNAGGNYEGPVYRISAAGLPRFVGRVWGGDAAVRPFVWTKDGWLHFVMWSTASDRRPLLYRLRADGGSQEVESQLPFGRDGLCSISGDARRWVCVVNRQLSDIYLMRNFDPEAR
jgi:serine/threonine protein kinase